MVICHMLQTVRLPLLAQVQRRNDGQGRLQARHRVAHGQHRILRLVPEGARLAIQKARGRMHHAGKGALAALGACP